MYIDDGRKADLVQLDQRINDMSRTYKERKGSYMAKQSILKQLKDRKLAMLRSRLIKATVIGDEWECWKITNQIKEHLREERIEWWSTKDERS